MRTHKSNAVGVTEGASVIADLFNLEDVDEKGRLVTKLASKGKLAVPDVIKALYCEDPVKIADLCCVLVAIGKPSIRPLVAELDNPNQFVQKAAISVLAELGAAAANQVLSVIAKGNQASVGAGITVIRQMGVRALPALKAASDPKSPQYSSQAIELLIELDAQALNLLIEYLKEGLGSKDHYMAKEAINTFKQMGNGAVPQLVGFLEDPNPYVQQNAKHALVEIGQSSIPSLITALGAQSPFVQQNAYASLVRIGKPAVKPLLDALNFGSPTLVRNAKRLLLELSAKPDRATRSWWRR